MIDTPVKIDLDRFLRSLQRNGATRRWRLLDARRSWYEGTNYRHLRYDFDSMPATDFGEPEVLSSDAPDTQPLRMRRPSVQAGFPKLVVQTFTRMLFGKGMKPAIVSDDEATQDFLAAVARGVKLWSVMRDARDLCGSIGTAALAVRAVEGDLEVEALDPRHLSVGEWRSKARQIPAIVVEQYRQCKEEFTDDGRFEEVTVWKRRLWDEEKETLWVSEPLKSDDEEPTWNVVGEVSHGLTRCPVVWITNSSPEKGEIDGTADWPDSLAGAFREIDTLLSSLGRTQKANLDPTVIFEGLNPAFIGGGGGDGTIKKGSGNALTLPSGASAKYLEATFAGFSFILDNVSRLTQIVKQATSCITFDPEKTFAAAPSGEALRRMLGPQIDRADDARMDWDGVIRQVLGLILEISRQAGGVNVENDLKPGKDGAAITLNWPSFVRPSPQEIEGIVRTALAAKGQVASTKTAVSFAGHALGVEDIEAEIEAIAAERAEREERFAERTKNTKDKDELK